MILAEYLDLNLEDVGGCIELVYMPVRKDGVKGSPRSVVSSPVAPGKFFHCGKFSMCITPFLFLKKDIVGVGGGVLKGLPVLICFDI